jgi:phosphoribosylformylglycinamidine synthase subunit PurL
MMLSESQERMLMVLKPGREAEAEAIFRKWELDFAVIGEVTDTGTLTLDLARRNRRRNLPLAPLADDAPKYDRPWVPTPKRAPCSPMSRQPDRADLLRLMACPDSRRSAGSGSNMTTWSAPTRCSAPAAMPRSCGCTARKGAGDHHRLHAALCFADPVEGRQAGRGGSLAQPDRRRRHAARHHRLHELRQSPTRPEIMGQFVGCIEGMAEACRALDFPVVSGNVSLYNETNGVGDPADAGGRRGWADRRL